MGGEFEGSENGSWFSVIRKDFLIQKEGGRGFAEV